MRKALVTIAAIVGSAALISLTAYLAREIDRVLGDRMAALKSQALTAMETALGRPISYDSISPSFLQYLDVRELAIRDRIDPARVLLTIKRVRVYYSLPRLLIEGDAVGSLREVRIMNTHLVLDTERDRDVIDLIRELADSAGGKGGGGGLSARFSGSDVSLDLTTPQGSFSFTKVFFQIGTMLPSIRVNLRGSWAGRLASGFSFASSLRLEGTVERPLNALDFTVRLASFDSSLFSTRKQTLQLIWKGSSVEVRKIQDRTPVDLDVTANLDTRMLTVSFQLDQLRPDQLVTLAGSLARYRSWMTAPITASGVIDVGLADGSLSYEVSLATALEDQLPVRSVSLLSSFRGDARQVYFEPLRLSTPEGTLEFNGDLQLSDLYPEGSLVLTDIGSGTAPRVSARLAIQRSDGRLEAKGSRMVFGELSFDAFDLVMTPVDGGAHFAVSTAFTGAQQGDQLQAVGELRFGQGLREAVSGGSGAPIAPPVLSLTASLRRIPPERLYHLLLGAGELTQEDREIYRALSRFSISTDLALSTDFSSFTLSSQKVTVTQADDPGTLLRFALSADTTHVVLSGFSGQWRGLTVEGGIEGSFPSRDQIEFSSDLRFRGLPYTLAGTYSPRQGLRASGSYNTALSAVTLRDGTISVSLSAERFPLPLAARPQIVSFDLQGSFSPSGRWVVSAPSLTVYDLPFLQSQKNSLELAGRLTDQKLELSRLRFTDAFSSVEGTATADLVLPPDLFAPQFLQSISATVSASLQSRTGELYSLRGTVNGSQIGAALQFVSSPIARITPSVVRGSLTGTAAVSGTFAHPKLDTTVRLTDGKLGTDPLQLASRVILDQQQVTLGDLSVGYLSHRLSAGSGRIDLSNGTLSLSARYLGEYFSDPVQLAVDLNASFLPSDGAGALAGLLDHGLKGSVTLSDIRVAGASYPSWGVAFRTSGGRLTFDGGPGGSIRGLVDSSSAFSLSLAQPLPVIGQVNGKIVGDQVSATIDVDTLDLLLLNPVLKVASISTSAGPLPVFKVTSGVASGQLTIDGPVNDPDYTGELDVVGGGLQSAYSADEAGPVSAQLVFDGKGFHSGPVTASVGNARVSVRASFTIDHWVPRSYDVILSTVGANPVRVRGKFGRFNADGFAAGQVEISGDDARTNVTGSLTASDCILALGDAPVGKFVPEDPPTFVSINAETGRRVEFNWPSTAFPVLRSTAVPGGKVTVTYRGDTGAYTVKGSTSVQGGEIYYFDRSFILTKGSITLDEDETSFDPRITAHAEVREWDPETAEEVKIYLDADSTLSTFSPRFSSDPARTDTAILAMLGAPLLTRAESQGLGLSAALISSDILSQSWILRPFEQKVRSLLNLDMFSIRTQLFQNLVAEKLLGTTINPLDNTSVSLGKYIGNDLFLEALLRLQSQQLPVGTALPSGTLPIGGIGLAPDVELSIEWATPFFLLNWSFQPKHPEDLFLTDNALSLTWKFSY